MLLHRLKLLLAPLAWKLLRRSVVILPAVPAEPPQGPFIFACLHRDILPAILYVRPWHPVLLVSTSPDGEILIRALGEAEYGFARGQTGHQGARALIELRRSLESGRCIGVAVDGPQGPYGSIQPGVLQLARLAGVPILPLKAAPSSAWVLRTWDRTVVPRPGSRVTMVSGPLLEVAGNAPEAERELARRTLMNFFNDPGVTIENS